MVFLVDTHCHLDFDVFDPDRRQVIQNAREAGIERIVIPGIDLSSSRHAVELAGSFSGTYAAVGVHPNDAAGWDEFTVNELRVLCRQPGVVAIGEIGLDYYRDYTPPDRQSEILAAQLNLAAEVVLPIILHCRKASSALYPIISAWIESLENKNSSLKDHPGVMHAFEGTMEDASAWNRLGFFLGIGGPITYLNAADRKELIRRIPLEWIVLETDAPFLAPQPFRGRRNEPAYIRLIAEAVAEIKKIPLEHVARVTGENAISLFGWSF